MKDSVRIHKMDMIWIATAKLLYPETSPTRLATKANILREIARLFQEDSIDPRMLQRHLGEH